MRVRPADNEILDMVENGMTRQCSRKWRAQKVRLCERPRYVINEKCRAASVRHTCGRDNHRHRKALPPAVSLRFYVNMFYCLLHTRPRCPRGWDLATITWLREGQQQLRSNNFFICRFETFSRSAGTARRFWQHHEPQWTKAAALFACCETCGQ